MTTETNLNCYGFDFFGDRTSAAKSKDAIAEKSEPPIEKKVESFGFDFFGDRTNAAKSKDTFSERPDSLYTREDQKTINVSSKKPYVPYEPLADATELDELVRDFRSETDRICNSADAEGYRPEEILARLDGLPEPDPKIIGKSLRFAGHNEGDDYASIEEILLLLEKYAALAVSHKILWGAPRDTCVWRPLYTTSQLSDFLHQFGIRCYGKKLDWLKARLLGNNRFQCCGFWYSAWLWGKVAFSDSVLDVRNGCCSPIELKDKVTATLAFPYDAITDTPRMAMFQEAMRTIAGTDDAFMRLQEMCGVAISAEPAGSVIFFQHWNLHLASLFTKLLSRVWSEDAVGYLNLRDHDKVGRTVQVLAHPIQISGKEGNSLLRDAQTILALADGDGINADQKYQECIDFDARCTIICAGRNLPTAQFGGIESLRQFLVRVNLTGTFPDISSKELLGCTREFVSWALEGLRRYCLAGGKFTDSEDSEIESEFISLTSFAEQKLRVNPDGKTTPALLEQAYRKHCEEYGWEPLSKKSMLNWLRANFPITPQSVRISGLKNGATVSGYKGIAFRDPDLLSQLLSTDQYEHDDEDDVDDENMGDDSDFSDGFSLSSVELLPMGELR